MSVPFRTASAVLAAGLGTGLLAAPAEAAATYALSVSGIDRAGKADQSHASVLDVRTGTQRWLAPGRTARFKAGTYAVTMVLGSHESPTIGTYVVKLTKNRKLVFDARKGQRVRFAVDDPTAELRGLRLLLLAKGHPTVDPNVWTPAGGTYVLPTTSKDVALTAYGVLERKGSGPSPYRYDLVQTAKGVPARPVFTAKRAKLARVDVNVRSFDGDQTGGLSLRPTSTAWYQFQSTELGPLPRTLASYRTPGLRWYSHVSLGSDKGHAKVGSSNDTRLYKAGRHKETWGEGVWGPVRYGVDADVEGRLLDVRTRTMICQPPETGEEDCTLDGVTRTARLYRGGTLLAQGSGDLRPTIPATSAWYTLKADARRPAGSLLSTRVTGTWKFKARALGRHESRGVALPLAVYRPRGLDGGNHAKRGSTTAVPVVVYGGTPRTLKIEASTDGGKTWRKLAVKREKSHWVVQVRNPGSAGFVSLRASITEKGGNSAVQTIVNAYGVR